MLKKGNTWYCPKSWFIPAWLINPLSKKMVWGSLICTSLGFVDHLWYLSFYFWQSYFNHRRYSQRDALQSIARFYSRTTFFCRWMPWQPQRSDMMPEVKLHATKNPKVDTDKSSQRTWSAALCGSALKSWTISTDSVLLWTRSGVKAKLPSGFRSTPPSIHLTCESYKRFIYL